MTQGNFALIAAALSFASFAFGRLTPETTSAFDHYVERAEAHMKAGSEGADVLGINSRTNLKAKLRGGETVIESGLAINGGNEEIPGGMIQDWIGYIFIPGANIEQMGAVLEDYANYKNFYKPEVIESKLLDHSGDDYNIFLRLHKQHLLTVVLNTAYQVHYSMPDAKHMEVIAHSTRVAEVKDPEGSYSEELPVGDDTGFLWRLNSYWHIEASDGGVYAKLEAISLSRDIPPVVGWMIKGFLEKFPKDSMMNTLRGTRAAVMNRKIVAGK